MVPEAWWRATFHTCSTICAQKQPNWLMWPNPGKRGQKRPKTWPEWPLEHIYARIATQAHTWPHRSANFLLSFLLPLFPVSWSTSSFVNLSALYFAFRFVCLFTWVSRIVSSRGGGCGFVVISGWFADNPNRAVTAHGVGMVFCLSCLT